MLSCGEAWISGVSGGAAHSSVTASTGSEGFDSGDESVSVLILLGFAASMLAEVMLFRFFDDVVPVVVALWCL